VAAGSVVLDDIPDFALIAGNPGVIKGWICRCGVRLEFEDGMATCDACGLSYKKEKNKVTILS